MRRVHILWLMAVAVSTMLLSCSEESEKYFVIETEYGNMKVKLYDDTPLHRDNFEKLVNEGFYNGLLFHRVIPGFMIQGGDPDSREAAPGQRLGMGGPGYQVDAEIGKPHLRGAIAAARNSNPEKKSSGSQFYIVQGQPQTAQNLDRFEQMKNIKYNDVQRQIYMEEGGTPQLDMEYTVFGEVVEGIEVVDKIAAVQRDPSDRPLQDVTMTIKPAKK
ncbi:MAG: peptidylprolyl isomerase [Saprospiraceae bacterium]|nr:peptidylprolyl isomerase [Saprospiraceae bacterium]